MYNLLQIGCNYNIDDLEYFEAFYLLNLKKYIDEEEEKQMKKQRGNR